jgi:hypothetical protein
MVSAPIYQIGAVRPCKDVAHRNSQFHLQALHKVTSLGAEVLPGADTEIFVVQIVGPV